MNDLALAEYAMGWTPLHTFAPDPAAGLAGGLALQHGGVNRRSAAASSGASSGAHFLPGSSVFLASSSSSSASYASSSSATMAAGAGLPQPLLQPPPTGEFLPGGAVLNAGSGAGLGFGVSAGLGLAPSSGGGGGGGAPLVADVYDAGVLEHLQKQRAALAQFGAAARFTAPLPPAVAKAGGDGAAGGPPSSFAAFQKRQQELRQLHVPPRGTMVRPFFQGACAPR